MTAPARAVALLTSDTTRSLPRGGAGAAFFVERHSWADDLGALDAATLVGRVTESDPLAMCIAEDVPQSLALEVARLIDERHPEIGVVMLRQPTTELWSEAVRAGIRDIVSPVAEATELPRALHLAVERAERLRSSHTVAAEATVPRGKVIVILSPKGGSGKTMVASNLAVALAKSNTGDTALVDLDCVFGDVASVLGLVPEHTVGQLSSLSSLDSTTLKVFLSRHDSSGLHVLAGSGSPEEGDSVTEKLSGQILDLLSRDFAYVVVDTAAGLDERALAAAELASDIVFLASMDVTSIRNLAKEISALNRLDLVAAHRHFILNRADARVGLEVADVEAVIGMKVDAALPSSRVVPLSMNQGTVIVIDEPDSAVAQQLLAFAQRFAPAKHALEQSPADRKGRFSIRRR